RRRRRSPPLGVGLLPSRRGARRSLHPAPAGDPPRRRRGLRAGGASHRGLAAAELEELVSPWLGPVGQPAFYRQIAAADERFTAELEPLLADLDCPTHIVWAAEDTWIPVDRAHRLQRAVPGSSLTVLPAAGHLV